MAKTKFKSSPATSNMGRGKGGPGQGGRPFPIKGMDDQFGMTDAEYADWIRRGKIINARADKLRAAGKTTPADGFPDLPPYVGPEVNMAVFMKKKK